MSALKYLLGLIPALLSAISIYMGGAASFLAPVVIFTIFPIMELLAPQKTENHDDDTERDLRSRRAFDRVLYASVPVQFALLAFFAWRVGHTSPEVWEIVGMTLSMGMSCGILGINVAHELGHRRKPSEQRMAQALLTTTLYNHFFIEHNRGHHANVSTDDDPASARKGEWLYAFFVRSIVGSYLSAWELENSRLRKQDRSVWTWDNQMIRFSVANVVMLAVVGLVGGPVSVVAFIGAALCGALLLETVNYLEHYGLRRELQPNGRYERVLPIHSWNSNHVLGRLLLFELSRHSDHHAHARRKYQTLRHFDDSPQLPTGYPGMMVLAWFPPLWFAVMHRHMERERQRIERGGGRAAVVRTDALNQAA